MVTKFALNFFARYYATDNCTNLQRSFNNLTYFPDGGQDGYHKHSLTNNMSYNQIEAKCLILYQDFHAHGMQ